MKQGRIAAILSAFDELIEINERRIELLEDLARSLYREWFVHFRFPGHENVEMVDSELGSIPDGWVVSSVSELASVMTRGISPRYADNGDWLVINQRCIRDQRISAGPARRHGGNVSELKRKRPEDVLINSTGVGTLGRIAWYRDPPEAITADSHVTIVRVASELQPWFAFSMLARQTELEGLGAGSTGQTELGRNAIGSLLALLPNGPVIREFGSLISPILAPLTTLSHAVESLAAARDLLLPRLVTGRLDISDLDLGVLTPAETE